MGLIIGVEIDESPGISGPGQYRRCVIIRPILQLRLPRLRLEPQAPDKRQQGLGRRVERGESHAAELPLRALELVLAIIIVRHQSIHARQPETYRHHENPGTQAGTGQIQV